MQVYNNLNDNLCMCLCAYYELVCSQNEQKIHSQTPVVIISDQR